MAVTITGTDDVLKGLKKEIKGIKGRTKGGLKAAGLVVQREAQKRVPVDTGNLKGSAYTRATDKFAEVGFTAAYALFVHENREQVLKGERRTSGTGKGYYWETGEPGFLANALREKKDEVVRQIVMRAKI